MTKKTRRCPRTFESYDGSKTTSCGGRMARSTSYVDGQWVATWECDNCNNEMRVQKRTLKQAPTEWGVEMTKQQAKTVAWLKAEIFRQDSLSSPDEYEFKEFEVRRLENSPLVFLRTSVGRKGDEGTMAEFFARSKRHLVIKSGGAFYAFDRQGETIEGRMAQFTHC